MLNQASTTVAAIEGLQRVQPTFNNQRKKMQEPRLLKTQGLAIVELKTLTILL